MALVFDITGIKCGIRHIPGKKDPGDSLSRQLIPDVLVREGSVKDANAEYVQWFRVPANALDGEIQSQFIVYSIRALKVIKFCQRIRIKALKTILSKRSNCQLLQLLLFRSYSWTIFKKLFIFYTEAGGSVF